MRRGTLAALSSAWRVLWREPWAWLPAYVADLLLLILLALVARLASHPFTGLEWHRFRWLVAPPLLLAAVAWTAVNAATLAAADRHLQGESTSRATFVADLPLVWGRLSGRLGASLAGWLLAVLETVFLLGLLTGADLSVLHQWLGDAGPIALMLAAWRRRGFAWVLGMLLWLAGLEAARRLLRWSQAMWPAAATVERRGTSCAMVDATRFATIQRVTLTGRWWLRRAMVLAALGLAWALFKAPAGLAARAQGAWWGTAALWVGVAQAVLVGSVVRCWLAASDLVLYRQVGGPFGEPELMVHAVRSRRYRVVEAVPERELSPATEPGGAVWAPPPASEPTP